MSDCTETCDVCGRTLDQMLGEDFYDEGSGHVYCSTHWLHRNGPVDERPNALKRLEVTGKMILQINEDYRLNSDSMNIIVQKRRVSEKEAKNPGEEYWTNEAHFSTVPQAAKWLVDQHVRDFEGSDVHTLLGVLYHLYDQIQHACQVAI